MHPLESHSSNIRAESPALTTTTTTQSVSSTSHSTTVLANNGQYSGNNVSNGNKGNNSNEQQQCKFRICRDFIRGNCRRLFCKYPHVQSPDLVVFCHDFQNSKCPRLNCKFLHYSIDDEEHYRKYGEFPIAQQQQQQQLQQQDDFSNNQNGVNNLNNSNNNNNNNVNHVDYSGDYECGNNQGFFSNNSSSNRSSIPSLLDSDIFSHHSCQQRIEGCSLHCHNSDRPFSNVSNSFRNSLKRLNSQDRDFMQPQQSKFVKRCRDDEILVVLRRFEEEHQMLKRRVEANELKIAELRASNEYLMTQNAQLRLSTVQVSRVVNPVTVTNTQSPQQTQTTQVINASMAPVQNPQVISAPIVSIATPQNQLIATPPNVPPVIGTIHATNASQPTQQILGTSQITLAPGAVPSIGLSINTSQALQAAISNATQPIISYPIMTHSILPH